MPSPPTSSAYFRSIPWTSHLLNPLHLEIKTPQSRTPKASTEDSLLAITLSTATTIPYCICYYPTSVPLTAINILYKMENGVNGYPHVLHGGMTATLMDESMGILLQEIAEQRKTVAENTDAAGNIDAYTKTLNVEFVRPIRTPGIVLVRVEVVERRGRGIKLAARVLQKEGLEEVEDGELVECARGEAVFVTPRVAKL